MSKNLLLWGGIILAAHVHAQTLPFDNYTTTNGLPSNWITALHQDAAGYLWIGTAEGVSVYDGASFQNYTLTEGLPSSFVWGLSESRTTPGKMYISTTHGIAKFDRGKFTTISLGPDRDANIVNCVVEDSQDVLWCGTNAGLYQVRRDSVFAVPGFAGVGVVSQLCMLGDSLMYVGAERDVYLLSLRTGRVRHVLATRIFGDPAFAFIAEDESRIWIISKDSTLYQIRGDTILAMRRLPVDAQTWSQLWMLRDEEGFLLIGARDGVKMLAREGWQQNDLIQYTIENGLPKSGFTCGLVDRENNLWFGSELKGLFKLSERSTLVFQLPEVTTGVMNNGAARLANGHFFVTLMSGLHEIWRLPTGGWRQHLHPIANSTMTDYPVAVQADPEGMLWVAFAHGDLYRYRVTYSTHGPSHLTQLGRLQRGLDLPDGHFFGGMFDREGRYWCSFENAGVAVIERTAFKVERTLTPADGLFSKNLRSICQDQEGNYWFGSLSEGLAVYRWNGERLQLLHTYTTAEGLPNNEIRALHVRRNGEVWIGTRFGGIAVWREGKFTRLTFKEGLLSNAVWGFAQDHEGRMWIATSLGLQAVVSDATHQLLTPQKIFGKRLAGVGRFDAQTMWALDSEALYLHEYKRPSSAVPPLIYITGVRMKGNPLPLQPHYECAHDEDHCEITFTGISFKDEKAVRYQYRLYRDGTPNAWQESTDQRVVTYAALKPGNYTFEVRALSRDGLASVAPAKVGFHILPPLWQRWWFLSIALALLTGVVIVLERLRVRRLLEIEKIRSRIATDLHDDIGAGLTHIGLLSEITLRQYQAQDARDLPRSDSRAAAPIGEAIERMGSVARELSAAMSDVVWSINPKHDSLAALLHRLTNFAAEICRAKSIELKFEVDDRFANLRLNPEVRRSLLLIAKEALHNMAKYSGSPAVHVAVGFEDRNICLQVEDFGKGFDVGKPSSGNGLHNMRLRAEKLNGKCAIVSENGRGTCVNATIPLH